ncbi:MAG: (2Fe-2S)-binding protein [Candidatus Hydrogenedentes bacterium]|nr:(2Fe-2S)-binding protein [Candidatus Hydrogenedentota bacterium]
MPEDFAFTINGRAQTIRTEPERTVLEVLREDLGLTGAKYGCGEGRCRACTVLVDDKPILSCVTPVKKIQGVVITSIEGLAQEDKLHPVQEAFLAEGALQCGYCTPGFVLQIVSLLRHNPKPSDEEIFDWLNPSLCRCCGYPGILRAVQRAVAAGKEAQ